MACAGLLCLGAALALCAAGLSAERAGPAGGPLPRALWVWAGKRRPSLVEDRAAWPGFFDFCDAPHGNSSARITALYLEAPPDLPDAAVRAFLSAAHARGLRVEFLFRDADWQAGHLEEAKAACGRCIETFNPAGAPAERFDGVHLDIENGGAWSQRAFRDLLVDLRRRMDAYHSTQQHRMTLAADLGFWWSERGEDGTPQYPDAVKQCDYIVCMAYRDTAGAQASCAVPQALAASRAGKGFWIGAETQHLPDQDFVTYYEEGWEHMEAELAKLAERLGEHGGALGGIALHHYRSYRDLVRERRVSPFPDVRLDYWAFPFILSAHQAGLVSGYPGGEYLPALPVSRDQMAVFISRGLVGAASVPPGPAAPSFPDVPPDHWAYDFVECVRAHSVAEGYEDGLYRPEDIVDRGQMAVFVARALAAEAEGEIAGYEPPAEPTFADVTPDSAWAWCHKHVEYVAAHGIVTGYPDGLYHPEHGVTREQMAVFVSRAFLAA